MQAEDHRSILYITIYFYGSKVQVWLLLSLSADTFVFSMQEVQEFTTPARGTLQTSCLTSAHSRLTSSLRAHRSATRPAVVILFLCFSCWISFFLLHQKYFWLDPRILLRLSVKEENLLCLCTFTVHVKQIFCLVVISGCVSGRRWVVALESHLFSCPAGAVQELKHCLKVFLEQQSPLNLILSSRSMSNKSVH